MGPDSEAGTTNPRSAAHLSGSRMLREFGAGVSACLAREDFVNLQLDQKNEFGLEAAGIKTAGNASLPCICACNLTESKDAGTIS